MYNIYKITNKINNKFYVGVTKSKYRFSSHISIAMNTNQNRPLQNAIRKYGRDNFIFEVIETGNDYEYGYKIREPYFIKKLKPQYNLTSGGDGIRNFKMPRHIVERVAEKNRGKKRSLETKKRISESLKGMVIPKEARDNMRIAALNSKNINERANHLNRKMKCKKCGLETNFANLKRWGHVI